jgi:uncharacterized lipoprotein YehR (DUF1307 family)
MKHVVFLLPVLFIAACQQRDELKAQVASLERQNTFLLNMTCPYKGDVGQTEECVLKMSTKAMAFASKETPAAEEQFTAEARSELQERCHE